MEGALRVRAEMKDDRLSDILANWRAFNRRPAIHLGFRPRALVLEGDGGQEVNLDNAYETPQSEAYADVDETEARTVQAVIDDLPGPENSAVYNVVMGTRRPVGEPLQEVYLRAREMLKIALRRRGVE